MKIVRQSKVLEHIEIVVQADYKGEYIAFNASIEGCLEGCAGKVVGRVEHAPERKTKE